MAFSGIPAEAFDYFDALIADNSKTFFEAHRGEYQAFVREPMLQLAADLEPEFGPAHLYRPYRDVRFSADKTPYKDHQGMFVADRNGLGWYVQISIHGFMAAGGWYSSTPEQVQRYRDAVDTDEDGLLQQLLDAATATGLEIGGTVLKTRPRGTAPDHPRLGLLRHRSLYLSRSWEPQPWLGTPSAGEAVRDSWRAMRPTMAWLADAAGPGEPPMGSRRGSSV